MPRIRQRISQLVILLLAPVLGQWLLAQESVSSASGPPNVLLILADDLGYADLGCYGGEIATPHLDALAGGGLRFTQFYNTARCWPTRASLLTGYYPQQVRRDTVPGLPSGSRGVRPGWARLLPELLRDAGYRSYFSGKWHLDGLPTKNGFARSYSLLDQGRFFSPQSVTQDDQPLPPVSRDAGYYATTAIADHAIQCLREHAAEHAGTPFFHYLAFTAPHFPLHALPADIARYQETYGRGWDAVRRERHARQRRMGIVNCELSSLEQDVGPPYDFPEAIAQLGPGELNRPLPWDQLTGAQQAFQAQKMAIHAAMVDRMDQEIGRVLQQLRQMNVFENTLIVFLSDNGASAEIMIRSDGHDPAAPPGSAATHLCLGPGWSSAANTPFRRHKTWVHEGGIATPFIVHWPQGIAARGEMRHEPAHAIDLVPTFLELANLEQPTAWQAQPVPSLPGISLRSLFTADAPLQRKLLWWLHEDNRAIRVGDWKLVEAKRDGKWELFDLRVDRAESQDRSAEFPEKVRDLEALWKTTFASICELALRDAPPDDRPANPAGGKAARKKVGKKKDAS